MDLAYLARDAVSAERALSRMLRSGFTISGHKIWTDEEDLVCRVFYPDYFAIRQILDTRSKKAIQTRCQKLGLVSPRQSWQRSARQQLRKLYPEARKEEICEIFAGVDWRKIQSAARYYGYRRKKSQTRLRALSLSIKVEAVVIGRTMRDFGEEAGTKRCFQTRGCRRKYPNFRAINRGVRALGGRLEIRWGEQR